MIGHLVIMVDAGNAVRKSSLMMGSCRGTLGMACRCANCEDTQLDIPVHALTS